MTWLVLDQGIDAKTPRGDREKFAFVLPGGLGEVHGVGEVFRGIDVGCVFDGPSGLQSGTSQGRFDFKTDRELLKNIWQSKIENFQFVYHKVATCVKNRYCHDTTIDQTFQSDSE